MTDECNNTEIRKEYVLSELKRKIFNDEEITYLTKGINDNLRSQESVNDDKKAILLKEGNEIESQITNIVNAITEADIRALLSDFSGYVISRNIPKCKKFIRDFVKEVVVFKEHIEVTFNVAFSFWVENQKYHSGI